MNERDPRVNPKPGDVLKSTSIRGADQKRRVWWVERSGQADAEVHYYLSSINGAERGGLCFINYWQRWAQNAEVIHRAD